MDEVGGIGWVGGNGGENGLFPGEGFAEGVPVGVAPDVACHIVEGVDGDEVDQLY